VAGTPGCLLGLVNKGVLKIGQARIPGYSIGKIFIQEKHTLVDVPEEFLPQVLGKAKEVLILKQPAQLQIA